MRIARCVDRDEARCDGLAAHDAGLQCVSQVLGDIADTLELNERLVPSSLAHGPNDGNVSGSAQRRKASDVVVPGQVAFDHENSKAKAITPTAE